ncbi:hypothetical protein AVEN_172475-1 [Araneus ventricosus]|uniref:Uncharacterized protein n=1 Tax=Araneus ventricosus TaxID=182803 RepID=A0A4Y2E168_ARAVE|nr:hypothetical protein AVEN_172475-1 [Araneus ventricosus]
MFDCISPSGKVSASGPEDTVSKPDSTERSAVYVSLVEVKSNIVDQTSSRWCGGKFGKSGVNSGALLVFTMAQIYEVRFKIALVLHQSGTLI